MQFRGSRPFFVILTLLSAHAMCQSLKPGLEGMAPSKWLTIRNTHAPGKTYRFNGTDTKRFSQEEYFMRAWVPLVHNKKMAVLLGPNYRTEQLEFKSTGENPISHMEGWNLRTFALDLNSVVKLDSSSWFIFTSHMNKSGDFGRLFWSEIPINYTLSASFLRKKSANKEVGFGVMMNKSFRVTVLPVFIFNYNFSDNSGLEMMLPKKIAFRKNLSPSDIIYLKSEAVSRTYYLHEFNSDALGVCRRVDIDLGMSYNRKIGNYAGVELFAGYRQNISNRLIEGAVPVQTSGFAGTIELYVQPPKFKRRK
ncbi:DUF6268 family outer membrane beta-barrel protein [Dyadobacter sp. CY347]|uniref:DUF6268 family outer membrane beta-barrel protein n=1 Tax=Dyadobacter sp. CY347 TaxID=2909336 RepID=UPI001F3964A8|nr:DUF6268 family outer membrane beta-barrel protein [Dyadobacter sp. CY347]MCF2489868.1 DUF6268 family outer membrane beta-barrel protein [Dyadobacter sp. CY347]